MNPNRQNNCCAGRPVGRPVNVIGTTPCCSDVRPSVGTPCCSDVVTGGIIVGGCADPGCNKETTLSGMPLAMAYVPWQSYGNIYQLSQALHNGTMFAELNLDFAGRRCNQVCQQ